MPLLTEARVRRELEKFVKEQGSQRAAGRELGFTSGNAVGQMLRGLSPISTKVAERLGFRPVRAYERLPG